MRYLSFLLLIGCLDQSEKFDDKSTSLQIDGIPDDDLELGSNLKIKVTFEGGQWQFVGISDKLNLCSVLDHRKEGR